MTVDSYDKAARIERKKRLGLMVRIYFNVLVRDFLFFENDPHSLNERAEPA